MCSFRNHSDDPEVEQLSQSDVHPGQCEAVSAAPKSLEDDYPMQIEEPRSYKTATGSLEQNEGFRVLPIVTEEELHRSMNFRVAPLHKALVSVSKVCRKRLSNHPGFQAWTKWHASQTHERMDRVARRKRCPRFRWLGFSGSDSRDVDDVTSPVDFSRQEHHP